MKLLEALIKVRDGDLTIIDRDGNKIKRNNHPLKTEEFIYYNVLSDDWFNLYSTHSIIYATNKNWEIYEEPVERYKIDYFFCAHVKKGCEPSVLESYEKNTDIPFPAKSRDEAIAWTKALKTFFELKSHPLRVIPKDCTPQSLICATENSCTVMAYMSFRQKLSELSPCFESQKDAFQAITDIGSDNLFHMFRTFQGIYE